MESFLRDLRHAARNLARTPGFAIVTILTLALGIGANTAIFSVVNAVILRPLGYPHPEQLIYISSQFPNMGFDQFWVSPPEFFEFQERTRTFSSVGAYSITQVNVSADRPRRAQAAQASAELFKTLGVEPAQGRVFEVGETRPGGAQVALLSNELWQSAFGARRDIVGNQIEIDGVRRTVIGVMPPHYDIADQHVEVWLPLVLDPANRRNRGNHYLYLIGRLAPGQTQASAGAELDTLLSGWQRSITGMDRPPREQRVHTPDAKNHRLRFDPLQAQIVGSARTSVWVLQGAVLFVLLIACANLANLLLAHAERRHKEFAVRAALGAGRIRLLRQFLTEGCLLSVSGAALGIAVAAGGVRALIAAYPDSLPRSAEVALDARVLAFTLLVALATGAVFGLAPLLHIAPEATALALKEGGQRSTAGGRQHLRRGLVVGEIALAVALVIGAGLLLRTVANLTRVDAGFARGQLVTFLVDLPSATYKTPQQIEAFYHRLLDRLRATAGVQGVAAMSGLPPQRRVDANDTSIEGYKAPPDGPYENIDYYQIATPGYAETMGIPVVEGRTFQPSDAIGPKVVMVNQTMARTFYGTASPIGRRVRPMAPPEAKVPWFTIVGVLKDVKQGGVDRKTGTEVYFDFEQLQDQRGFTPTAMNVMLRTSLPADALGGTIRQMVAEQDPALPIVKLRAMDDVFAESIGRPRLLAQLLGMFAALAVLLAAIGSYGVLSYMVSERRREIGIRMALGADRGSVVRMVLGHGLRLAIAGVIVGLTAAFALNRVLSSLLFGVKPTDPATIGAVVALVGAVALVACYLPAHGATRVDPMIVLRED
jgi:putative ABC transport system permease protein